MSISRGEAFARVNVDVFVFIPANASPLRYGNATSEGAHAVFTL